MLRYWLPFNGNLTNQGLDMSTITPSSTSLTYGDGKVCVSAWNSSSAWLKIPYNYASTNEMTIAFWVKPNTPNAWSDIFSFGAGANRLEVTNTTNYSWYVSSGSTLLTSGTVPFALNNLQWYHVAIVADGSTVRFYLDGVLKKSVTQANTLSDAFGDSTDFLISARTTGGGNRYYSFINDFRIYDNAISTKEVKLLSQGLVAHYQLKGLGRINYLKGAGLYTVDNPLIRNANDVTHMNDSYVYYDTGVLSVTVPADGTYSFILESDGVPTGHPTSGTVATSRYFSIWLQNTSTSTHYLWSNQSTGANGEKYGQFTLPAGTYRLRTNLYAADSVNYRVKFWNMRLVQGSYASDPWQPNPNDALYSSLGFGSREPDCSGFGNHGTKSNVFDVSLDSPRYGRAYIFPGSYYIACGRGAMVKDAITVSCWAYMDDWTAFTRTGSCTESGGWNFEPSGDYLNFALGTGSSSNTYKNAASKVTLSSLSGWHMMTGTYDGLNTKIYIDGVLSNTNAAYTTKTPIYYHASNGIFIGAEAAGSATTPQATYFNGRISDFRIYGTALSADDIAELHNNSASLTKDGKLIAYDFHEDKRNAIDKNGVVVTSGFNTKAIPTYDMKIKALDDGSTWARIHHLDVTNDKTWFASATEVAECTNKNNRYSRMGIVDKYKPSDGNYEFMLTYPSMKKTVPAGYTQLEYIEATGTQYIKTGVTGAAKWEFDIQFTNTTTRQLMGYGGSGSEYWGSQENGMYGLATWGYMNVASGGRDTIVHDYTGSNSLWVKNVTYGISQTDVTSKQYQIFAIDGGYLCKAKLYRCKCIQSGSLIRDFIPARRDSDNVIGLLDIVNNVFYTNSGSGSFTGGPPTDSIPLYNRWIQTSSPNASTVTGYKAINTAWTSHNAGIRKHGTSAVYDCDTDGTWYAPIGQTATWTSTQYIPAADGTSQTETELWVRTDRFADEDQLNIYDGSMTATSYVEI